jgi:hypothetical protein
MKNIIYTLALISISLFAFTSAGEESSYEGTTVSYNVAKEMGIVTINLGLKEPSDFEEILIMRSDNPSANFRRIKELNQEAVDALTKENVLIDKYPLPSSVVTYYKVQTVDKTGVQRTYPCVKLASK